jgi:hypothetical protein
MSIAPHKRCLIRFKFLDDDRDFSIYANTVTIDQGDEIVVDVDMHNVLTNEAVLWKEQSVVIPFMTISTFSNDEPVTMDACIQEDSNDEDAQGDTNDEITLGSQDTVSTINNCPTTTCTTLTGTLNGIMLQGVTNGIIRYHNTCTCTTSTQVCHCFDTDKNIVDETPYEDLVIDLTEDYDATAPQDEYEDDDATIIADDTEEYVPYVASDSDPEQINKKRNRKGKDTNAIWLSRKRKVRSDKGKMKGVLCNVCMQGRQLCVTCGRCRYDVCIKCVTSLIEHGTYVNICVQCRAKI